jgi:hypothetical protein
MFDVRGLVMRSHEKIIDHYRRLLETSRSEEERETHRAAIRRHDEELKRLLAGWEQSMKRAA